MTASTPARLLTLGVTATTRKEDERRLPIHPLHFERIDPALRERIFLEHGYGEQFGVATTQLAPQVGGMLTREQLVAECDVILLPKPLVDDVARAARRPGAVGLAALRPGPEMTQLAIDKRLTLIAFEAMNHWRSDGSFKLHVFHKNNEIAGYCSVLHALQLIGSTGDYGRRLRAVVIGFGATARGAVTALNALGVHDVDVLTQRGAPPWPRRSTRPGSCSSTATRGPGAQPRHRRRRARSRCRRSSPRTTSSSTACCRTPTPR